MKERALFLDDRGAMRVTAHPDEEMVVLSIWHGAVCRATFRLTPEAADRLAAFLHERAGLVVSGKGARQADG
jgi:hypothetical protein